MCAGIRDADDFFSLGCELAAKPLATMRNPQVKQDSMFAAYSVDVLRSQLSGDSRLWLPACSRGDGHWQLSPVEDFEKNCGNEELFHSTKLCKTKESCLVSKTKKKAIHKKVQEKVKAHCTAQIIVEKITDNDMRCGTKDMDKNIKRLDGMVKGLKRKDKKETTLFNHLCSIADVEEAWNLLKNHCTPNLRGDATGMLTARSTGTTTPINNPIKGIVTNPPDDYRNTSAATTSSMIHNSGAATSCRFQVPLLVLGSIIICL
jgi:hypothetical protein